MNASSKSHSKFLPIFFALAAALLFLTGVFLYFQPYLDGYNRQHQEESMAFACLENWIQEIGATEHISQNADNQHTDSQSSTSNQEVQSYQDMLSGSAPAAYWTDDVYYERDGVCYTPEYATGTLDCILIIPKIQLCRGIYTGTMEDILHNLDVWMLTVAEPDCALGATSYCVYGHNTPRLNLSFNRLQTLELQDCFYLVNSKGEYKYTVTDILGVAREQSAAYTQADADKQQMCYLLTCGRDAYRYLDLVIEGTLEQFTPLDEVNIEDYFLLSSSSLYLAK